MRFESRSGPIEVSIGDIIAVQDGHRVFEGMVLEASQYHDSSDHGYFRLLIYDFNDAAGHHWGFDKSILEESFTQSVTWSIVIKHKVQ